MQNNIRVVEIFSETTSDVVHNFEAKHQPITFTEMESAIKEYEEFEELEIDLSDMERIFREEFGANILKST